MAKRTHRSRKCKATITKRCIVLGSPRIAGRSVTAHADCEVDDQGQVVRANVRAEAAVEHGDAVADQAVVDRNTHHAWQTRRPTGQDSGTSARVTRRGGLSSSAVATDPEARWSRTGIHPYADHPPIEATPDLSLLPR